jgi:type VI secretion system protein ImpA
MLHPAPTPGLSHCAPEWLQAVAGDAQQPCGANLEYDNDYAVLQSLLTPKVQVQYGSFTAEPEPPDWSAIERQARALSQRTRDITVLCAMTRARAHRAGAVGLREGLAILHAQLHQWPEHIHPQAQIDGQPDPDGPLVRANALAALTDPQGLLADIRQLAISTSAAAPLSVKDVERALSSTRSAYNAQGPDASAVRQQLTQLRHQCDERLQALIDSAHLAQGINTWCQQHLQQDAPDLQGLTQVLGHMRDYAASPDKVQAEAVEEAGGLHTAVHTAAHTAAQTQPWQGQQGKSQQSAGPTPQAFALDLNPSASSCHEAPQPAGQANTAAQREHIRALLGQVIAWIEHHEPSSPVSIVLRQAQNLWGKRYAEIIAAVPPELLAQWDAQLSQEEGGV